MNKSSINAMRYLGIFLNIIILVLTLFTLMPNKLLDKTIISILIIIIQVVSILQNQTYQNIVDNYIFKTHRKEILYFINPCKKIGGLQNARDELRYGLNIVTAGAILCCLYWAFLTQNPLKFIACICIISVTYMYADYIPHAKTYAEQCDKNINNKDNSVDAARGLAKIYKEEYDLTGFEKNHAEYKKLTIYDDSTHCDTQDKCIKSILFMKVDSIKCPNIVYSILLTFFNVFLVIPTLADTAVLRILGESYNNVNELLPYVLIVVNVVFSTFNLVTLFKYERDDQEINKIYNAIKSDNYKDRLNLYDEMKDDSDFQINRSRGIFVFCSQNIDDGIYPNKIDIKYRMLFIHRYYANIQRFWITAILSILTVTVIFMDFKINAWIIICVCLAMLLLSLIVAKYYLPVLGKQRISKICKLL